MRGRDKRKDNFRFTSNAKLPAVNKYGRYRIHNKNFISFSPICVCIYVYIHTYKIQYCDSQSPKLLLKGGLLITQTLKIILFFILTVVLDECVISHCDRRSEDQAI